MNKSKLPSPKNVCPKCWKMAVQLKRSDIVCEHRLSEKP